MFQSPLTPPLIPFPSHDSILTPFPPLSLPPFPPAPPHSPPSSCTHQSLSLRLPLLQASFCELFYVGDIGTAMMVKVVSNMLACVHVIAMGEVLMLGVYQGEGGDMGSRCVQGREGLMVVEGGWSRGWVDKG